MVGSSFRDAPTSLPALLRGRAINPHLTIHRNGNKFIRLHVLELHHLMPFPCQLSPSAGLLRVLLNRLIFPTVHLEHHRPEATGTRPANRNSLALHLDGVAFHHLLRDWR